MELQAGIVYGPLESRRLGRSLGVNLTPPGRKTCNYNCAYCQYGWTEFPASAAFPRPADVVEAVDQALARDPHVDAITVAGNGEPTLHPGFAPLAEGLFHVRARRAPQAKLALLSNASTLGRLDVVYSLSRFDERCMKFDAGDATTFRLMNAAMIPLGRLVSDLRAVGKLTLQSMFVRDAERTIDNTTPRAVDAWLEAVDRIRPERVDVYTIARAPARPSLLAAPREVLDSIAARLVAIGVPARVF
jgi:wyosine [tRNA(Phe)-imidazoG37] synthetase (radical SAM superfamily)